MFPDSLCLPCGIQSEAITIYININFQVIINNTMSENKSIPVVLIEAGQDAGLGPVSFALYIIEQLVACSENNDMIRNVNWVILPSTNPDGMEIIKSVKFMFYYYSYFTLYPIDGNLVYSGPQFLKKI